MLYMRHGYFVILALQGKGTRLYLFVLTVFGKGENTLDTFALTQIFKNTTKSSLSLQ